MQGIHGLILDIVLIALLAGNAIFCLLLHRRLSRLRDGAAELRDVLEDFSAATARAEAAVAGMKSGAGEEAAKLQDRMRDGQSLLEELQFMVESGGNLAARLERAIGAGRLQAGDPPAQKPAAAPAAVAAEAPSASRAERELIQALRKGG
jgi:hypothetical protein